jgi:V8-like Glu-specific endopeptidase
MSPPDPKLSPFVVQITAIEHGSGVLISPDEVLTASHIVFDPSRGPISGRASSIVVTVNTTTQFDGVSGHFIPFQSGLDPLAIASNDFAVIHLSRPVSAIQPAVLMPDFAGGSVNLSGYPLDQFNSIMTDVTIGPVSGVFTGTGDLGPGSSGGPVWIADSSGNPLVVGLVSGGVVPGTGEGGLFTRITSDTFNVIENWILDDDQPTPDLHVEDTSIDEPLERHASTYDGPVTGVNEQYIEITTDNLNVSVGTPNWFIHTGSGEDAIAVSSGTNVLDGGAGSNFLTGGSGSDTFFVDDRDPGAIVWSTVVGFHAGDDVTIWGVTPSDFNFQFEDNQGATGFTGLTLEATATDKFTAKLTLTGFDQTDIKSGRLSISFGIDPASGSEATVIHANS